MNGYTQEEKERVAREDFKLIHYMVKKFNNIVHIDKEDKISAATIGFVTALNNYDKSLGSKFSTFACESMNFELLKLLRYEDTRANMRNLPSINAVKGGIEKEYSTLFARNDENFNKAEFRIFLEEAMKILNEREKAVLLYRLEEKTSKEISELMGDITDKGVDYHRKNIVKKLKKEWEQMK